MTTPMPTAGVGDHTHSITIPVAPVTQPLATPDAQAALVAEAAAVAGQTPAPGQTNPSTGRLFTEEEIVAARRQEKDKLYPQLQSLEQRLAQFEAEREAAQRAAQEAAEREAAERRQREEAEMSAKELLTRKEDEWKSQFNTAQQEWEEKFNRLQAESEARAAALEKERQFQELQSYKNRRLAEEQDNIMPDLMDLVDGNTAEEIEASIQRVVAKTSAIVSSIQQSLPAAPVRPKGISAVGGTPSGPLDNAMAQQTLTMADIAKMSMKEYEAVRDRLLPAASRR